MARASAAATDDSSPDHHARRRRRPTQQEREAAAVVRFAASKVAAVVGLHEFGDATDDFLEVRTSGRLPLASLSCCCCLLTNTLSLSEQLLYQDREELLAADARALRLQLVTKDDELDALVAQTGDALAPQLRKILRWTAERRAPAPAQLEVARSLLADVDKLLVTAQQQRSLDAQEALDAKRLLQQKIHQSVGVRNEHLALRAYEQQHGCVVRLTNEHWYWLRFPPLPADTEERMASGATDVFAALDAQAQRRAVPKDSRLEELEENQAASQGKEEQRDRGDSDQALESEAESCYFSICGMVDGVADVLGISTDDDWTLSPAVVEVKNRVRAFRDPPPLHDHIQMAVYMKMLDVTQGDLVQCLNTDRATIKVSRISLHEFPLGPQYRRRAPASSGDNESEKDAGSRHGDLWTSVILPRLYQYTAMLHKVRSDELSRLAFLNGMPSERLEMLRRECDFL